MNEFKTVGNPTGKRTIDLPSRELNFKFSLFVNSNDSQATIDHVIQGELAIMFPARTFAQSSGNVKFLFDYTPLVKHIDRLPVGKNQLTQITITGILKVRVRQNV